MNFEAMWSIQHGHSDLMYVALSSTRFPETSLITLPSRFWIIALPVMAVVLPMFIAPDIVRIVHYCKKKMTAQRAKKTVKVCYSSTYWDAVNSTSSEIIGFV